MGFIVNNIAPAEYSPLQKFFAIYQYVISHSVYTDILYVKDLRSENGGTLAGVARMKLTIAS